MMGSYRAKVGHVPSRRKHTLSEKEHLPIEGVIMKRKEETPRYNRGAALNKGMHEAMTSKMRS